MTVRANKPALSLREEITKAQSNNADEARIGSLVSDNIDAVAIDAEQLSVGGWVSGNPNYNDIVINSPDNGGLTIFTNSPTSYGGVVFHDDNTQTSSNRNSYAGGIYYQHTGNAMEFYTNTQERARIDSSGNLLVGKTSSVFGTAGVEIDGNNDRIHVTKDGGVPLALNRLTSDGDIAQFFKDGTTVGSIATKSGFMALGSDDSGVIFNSSANNIYPWNVTTNAATTGVIDLGSSTAQFKDLYLSGGVYLGGTGAANHLDDYEEGDWSTTWTNLTVGDGTWSAQYTKVGRLVHLTGQLTFGSTTAITGNVSLSTPFAANRIAYGIVRLTDAGTLAYQAVGRLNSSSIAINKIVTSTTDATLAELSSTSPFTWTTGDIINISISYETA